jgi:tetratricopeptide (TPR) repeat protein/predicted nucleotidyltransferase
MNPAARQIAATWLTWRYGRVIAFPWESILPEMDLLAYSESLQRPLVDVAAEVSSGQPERLLLGILQAEFRALLESFVNSLDWGFGGGPVRYSPAYPRAQAPLGTMRIVAESLRTFARVEMEAVLARIGICESAGKDIRLDLIAQLLATFYSAFPHLAQSHGGRAVTLSPPPAIDSASYVSSDPAYRAPVAELTALVHDKLSWAFRFVLLHGSLATEDYLPGISDFDTFAIVRDDVASSAGQLLALRTELLAVYPCLYGIDPLQHHGVMLCAEQDTAFYPQAFFPFTLFDHGCAMYAQPGYELRFTERDDSYERAHTLYQIRQNYRWLASEDWQPASQFDAKLQVQRLLLAPALFFQRSGTYLYKRESFPAMEKALGPAQLVVQKAEEIRARNLYGVPLSWTAFERSGGELGGGIREFHKTIRNFPVSPSLLESLGPHFWRDASYFLDLLCNHPANQNGFLEAAADSFSWENDPRPIPAAAYRTAVGDIRSELKALDPRLELWEFGSVAHPGISDLDLLVEVPNDESVPTGLNRFTATIENDVFQHPLSMILRRGELSAAGKLYPMFDARRCEGNGTAPDVIHFGDEYAPYQLCALAEMACCYFFRQTLGALLERRGNLRQVLLSVSGFKHSLRVLRANGVETRGLDEFAARVRDVRERWFQMDPALRRRETLTLMFDAVSCELSILDSVRRGIRALADCDAALAPFSPGAIVGVLFNEVFFIQDWAPDTALSEMMTIYRRSGSLKLIYPAEIAVLLARYTAGSGVWQQFLATQFVHTIADPDAIAVSSAVEDRRRQVEAHYRFLRDRGLRWGGPPQWSFDPTAPAAADSWINDVRSSFSGPRPLTIDEYVERWKEVEELLQRARENADAQRWNDALPVIQKVLQLAPRNPGALYLLGVCFIAGDNPDRLQQAVALLSQALEVGFDPVWARLFRAQAHLRLGNIDAAEADLQGLPSGIADNPAVVRMHTGLLQQCRSAKVAALVEVVKRHVDTQKAAEAVEAADAVLRIDPDNAIASYLKAFALHSSTVQQLSASLAGYQRALDCGFDPFWIYYNRSQLRLAVGDLPRAIEDLAAAKALNPDHTGIPVVEGLIRTQERGR